MLGREFAVEVLAAMAGRAPEEVLGALEPALAASVAGEVPEAPGRLRFAHVLIRDALYEALPARRRLDLERSAAEALLATHAANLDPHLAAIAHHYQHAGPAEAIQAMDYTARAGALAAAQLAFEEAARHYRVCLRLREGSGHADERVTCELLLSLGETLSRGGDEVAAKAAFARAAELAESSGQPDRLARAAVGYGGRFAWARAGTDRQLVPLIERALAAIGPDDSEIRVRLLARLAGALRDEPLRDRRVGIAEESLAMARRLGDPRPWRTRSRVLAGRRRAGERRRAARGRERAHRAGRADRGPRAGVHRHGVPPGLGVDAGGSHRHGGGDARPERPGRCAAPAGTALARGGGAGCLLR